MAGNSKGFNVARALKQFMAATKEQDDECTILPLAGIINMFCIGADVPNSKDEIEQYFRHDVKFNSINSKLRIHTSQDIDGITLGWTLKAHPVFCYRDDMKEALYNMMR
jgi:hypothetical protein